MAEVNNLVIVGKPNAGKTCLIRRYVGNMYDPEYDPPIEDNYRATIKEYNCIFEIYEEQFSEINNEHIKKGDVFMFVFSMKEMESFEIIRECITTIKEIKNNKIYSVLVGTKCDDNENRMVEKIEGENLAKEMGWNFYETSAEADINADKPFIEAARLLKVPEDTPITSGSTSRCFLM